MIIGVTGYGGRLGSELVMNWGCEALRCDITDTNQIINALRELKPDVVINCAAYTSVDGCETYEGYKKAITINTRAVEYLRRHFSKKLIHISSDYIFDGKKGPYREVSHPSPVNSYGFSKLGGEELLRTSPYIGQTTVVRTTGLYGGCSGKHDFASLVVDYAYRKEELICSSSLMGNQTYIPHLAESLVALANMSWKKDFDIIHLASSEVISRYEFATMLGNIIGTDFVRSYLRPAHSKDIEGWVAPRPTKGGLKVEKAVRLGLPIYSIYQGIKAYKKELSEI